MRHRLLVAATALVGLFVAPQDPAPKPAAKAAPPEARPEDVATPTALLAALYASISGGAGVKRDWQRVRSLFHADARLVPMAKGKDGMAPRVLTIDDYVQRAAPVLERDGFFEQEVAQRVEVFGDLAHAWSTYETRRAVGDERPFLRGINSVQMVRQGGRWHVLHIAWEQESDGGPIPAAYLPAK